jgi:hypothetical protein
MVLTADDLKAMQNLFQEEIEPVRQEMHQRFDAVAEQILGLYQGNEKREQEYLFLNHQASRHEKRLVALERKSA